MRRTSEQVHNKIYGFLLNYSFFGKLVLCLTLMSVPLASAQADQILSPDFSVEQWLKRMQTATVEENYRGTFMFRRGGMSSAMSIVHRYSNGVENERLKQLDGEMGEIIRQGETVMCIFPDNRVVQVAKNEFANKFTKSFSDFIPEQDQYELIISGYERMADRACIVIEIRARDAHRYSYRLWLDKEFGLLLKSVTHNEKENELENFQYTQIDFPENIDDAELAAKVVGDMVTHVMIPPAAKDLSWPSDVMWNVSWAPTGFQEINGEHLKGENVMVYSDGLATYSVFIEKVKDDAMPQGASQIGATVAYALQRKVEPHQYNVTVIGEIPPMTAMKIANGVHPQ